MVKNVSGVFQGQTFGGFAEEFIIRGFETGFTNYLDGFRFPAIRIGTANVERVDVVKGAAANLYGRIEPGGLINVVTKRPLAIPYYSLQQQFGSFDLYRTTADATGPITADGSLLYRFNLEYLDENSFRDFAFTDRIFVAPSLTWNIAVAPCSMSTSCIPTRIPWKTRAQWRSAIDRRTFPFPDT